MCQQTINKAFQYQILRKFAHHFLTVNMQKQTDSRVAVQEEGEPAAAMKCKRIRLLGMKIEETS